MHFIELRPRLQDAFGCLEDQVGEDHAVRMIGAFIERLDWKRLAIGVMVKAPPKTEGFDELLAKRKKWNSEPGKIVRAFFQIDLILKNDDADECSQNMCVELLSEIIGF